MKMKMRNLKKLSSQYLTLTDCSNIHSNLLIDVVLHVFGSSFNAHTGKLICSRNETKISKFSFTLTFYHLLIDGELFCEMFD